MKAFLDEMKLRARTKPMRILFAEGSEPRVIEAAKIIREEAIANPILLTELDNSKKEIFAQRYSEIRNVSIEEARDALNNPHAYATMMLLNDEADALITGPTASSKERILPALKLIDTKKPNQKASAFFFMVLPKETDPDAANGGVLLFADCALNIAPTAEELAHIAIDTAETARMFGIEPIVAMLSFSTDGSTEHPLVKKVQEATKLVNERAPELKVLGDVQVDAALIDQIGERKTHGNPLAGHANVLIFPDLEAGNIGYKLVERLAGAEAIGPIIQGLEKPVNELSRGCDSEDIVNLAALTAVEAQKIN